MGPRPRRGRGARARALRGARGADRRQARQPDARPARRPDPDARRRIDERDDRPSLQALERRRPRHASCASPTPTRRCCATSPSAASRPGDDFEVVEKQPFDGPLFARFGDEVHVLGGALARAMRVERCEPRRRPHGDVRPSAPSALQRVRASGRGLRACCRCSARRSSPASPTSTPATSPRTSPAARSTATCCCGCSLAANLMAMLIQNLSAKIGIATGRNLPELCREHFPRPVTCGLWVQAELIAMATDLAEFVGAAIALNLLFGVPLFAAGPDDRRRRVRRSSRCRPAATAASSSRSPGCSASSCSASSTTRCGSASTPARRAERLRARASTGTDSRAARHRHPRRDGDAARDLPALGADAGPHPAARRRRAPRAAALPAHRRDDRDGRSPAS